MRVKNHPILKFKEQKDIKFEFENQTLIGKEGDTIASALVDNEVKVFGYSYKKQRPRGFYCAIGNCGSCQMEVNGKIHVRTCITPLEEGMVVKIQRNKGVLK